MLSATCTLHRIIITQPHGESKQAEDCVEKLIQKYTGATRVKITGVLARQHHLTFQKASDAAAAATWVTQNYTNQS